MSTFFIGQRVRVVRVENWRLKHIEGAEATIIDRAPSEYDCSDWLLSLYNPMSGAPYGVASSGIEPILPTGLESLDRINELYEPEPEVIRV